MYNIVGNDYCMHKKSYKSTKTVSQKMIKKAILFSQNNKVTLAENLNLNSNGQLFLQERNSLAINLLRIS
jgi:hypothetical protein